MSAFWQNVFGASGIGVYAVRSGAGTIVRGKGFLMGDVRK